MPKRKTSMDSKCPGYQPEYEEDVVDKIIYLSEGDTSEDDTPKLKKYKDQMSSPDNSDESGGEENVLTLHNDSVCKEDAGDEVNENLDGSGSGNEGEERGAGKATKNMNEDSVILKPQNLPFLYQIVDKLDLKSFLKLSKGCQLLSKFCFKPGEMMRTYIDIESMDICMGRSDSPNFSIRPRLKDHVDGDVPLNYSGKDKGFLYSVESRKKLKDLPFRFNLESLDIDEVPLSKETLTEIRSLLAEFPIKSIPRICGETDDVDWKAFVEFVKDFRSEHVTVFYDAPCKTLPVPDEHADYLIQNYVYFETDRYVSDSVIRNASTPHLWLPCANISRETYIFLLMKVAHSTQEFDWEIGRQSFIFGHYKLFEVVDIKHNEQVDGPLPETRPLIFCNKNARRCKKFQILRMDGTRIQCAGFGEDNVKVIIFRLCPLVVG